jgi:hypothetical protein
MMRTQYYGTDGNSTHVVHGQIDYFFGLDIYWLARHKQLEGRESRLGRSRGFLNRTCTLSFGIARLDFRGDFDFSPWDWLRPRVRFFGLELLVETLSLSTSIGSVAFPLPLSRAENPVFAGIT